MQHNAISLAKGYGSGIGCVIAAQTAIVHRAGSHLAAVKIIVIDSAQFRNVKDINILKGTVIVMRTSVDKCYNRCIERYKINGEKYKDIKYGIKLCNRNIGFNDKFYTYPYCLAFLLKRFLKEKFSTVE